MPRGKSKGLNVKEAGRRYRQAMRECAKLARQYPKGGRVRAYRECLKAKLKYIEAV